MSSCAHPTDPAIHGRGLNLVFAGTPEFAATHLQALLASRHQVVAVYTQPDRPSGRGRKLTTSPVKQLALQHQVKVAQPVSLRHPDAQAELSTVTADLMVVVAYGMLLPQAVLDIPPLGCINVHASSLPRWRGAAPIQRAILAGDVTTGISITQMDAGLDTGAILMHRTMPINGSDTAASLHDRLALLGSATLVEALDQLQARQLNSSPQDETRACYASKLMKAEGTIDWCQSATYIERQVRGLNPWPVCHSDLQGHRLRIWQTSQVAGAVQQPPGTLLALDQRGLLVACGTDNLLVNQLQWPGGKVIPTPALINFKQRLPMGACFGQPGPVPCWASP